MNNEIKFIGISGGTFDPIHNGHLIVAEHIRESFSLDEILFIPTGTPPHKNLNLVTKKEHRYNMVLEATKTNAFFKTSRMEIERQGYTYSIDTLMELKEIYNNKIKFFYIIGADVVKDITTWKEYERVFDLCEFISVLRPGFNSEEIENEIELLNKKYSAIIHKIEAPLIDISSTIVRSKVKGNKSIKYLVPAEVENYILAHSLYKEWFNEPWRNT